MGSDHRSTSHPYGIAALLTWYHGETIIIYHITLIIPETRTWKVITPVTVGVGFGIVIKHGLPVFCES